MPAVHTTVSLPDAYAGKFASLPPSSEEINRAYSPWKLKKAIHQQELTAWGFSPAQVDHANRLSDQYLRASNLVNDLILGQEVLDLIAAADEAIEQELPAELGLYAKQTGQSVKALYYYRRKEYARAMALTLECIVCNDYLVSQGLETHILRIIEQNLNVSRVRYAQGDKAGGLLAWKSMFDYLFNGTPDHLYGASLRNRAHWESLRFLREPFIMDWVEIFVFYLLLNANAGKEHERELFDATFDHLAEAAAVDTADRQAVVEWIKLKRKYFRDDLKGLAAGTLAFIKRWPSKLYDPLKLSLCQNVLYAAGTSGPLSGAVYGFTQEKLILKNGFKEKIICPHP